MNSGISRGLRRSKGLGFNSRDRPRGETPRDEQSTGVRRNTDTPSSSRPRIIKDGWQGGSRQDDIGKEKTSISPIRIRRGKKPIKDEEDMPRYLSLSKKNSSAERTSGPTRGHDQLEGRTYPRGSGQDRPADSSRRTNASRSQTADRRSTKLENISQESSSSYGLNGQERGPRSETQYSARTSKGDRSSVNDPKSSSSTDKRMPLSIPYTTPASEFLYGTSVVEAALHSQREPRRKLYKLYIYTGENRAEADPAGLERIAQRKGIKVARVGMDWLRILDKMSGGRPHNGYILEASPLPRLPVANLGELTDQDGDRGFKVSVVHQSREDAAVNGTSDFIKLPRNSRRNPFVLFLDSIEDPGNLGGIIRTAAFLGVTAVAYSVSNSASFTPVVLKASAGASENVTLFAVHKPAGFIANSKLAGWRIYAAVAPPKSKDPGAPPAISADDLGDPLSQDPCILMLGSEGEGLRANLRSKADVDLSIRGRGQSHNVDSLNVSVAAGILCDAFLRRNQTRERVAVLDKAVGSDATLQPAGYLF